MDGKTWLTRSSAVGYLPDCCCEPSSPALSVLVSGWITTNALFLSQASQAIIQSRRVPNRQITRRMHHASRSLRSGIPRARPAWDFLLAPASRPEQQVPPLRRRLRSGSGRDDKVFSGSAPRRLKPRFSFCAWRADECDGGLSPIYNTLLNMASIVCYSSASRVWPGPAGISPPAESD